MTTAILFPGQGSQSLGMLADIRDKFPSIDNTFHEASEALGYDLWETIQNGPEERLNSTEVTQPAILAGSIALWRLLNQEQSVSASYLAGHSLGEYSALVAAGVLDFADAVRLVQARGQFMQASVEDRETAMAAILGLDDEAVAGICAEVAGSDCVEAVNFNCPGQVVIAGDAGAVDRAIDQLKAAGAKRAMKLAVSVPSHCALMKPAAEKLAGELERVTFSEPRIPVIQNVSATAPTSLEELKGNLTRQLYSPVLWTQTVQYLVGKGVQDYLECGPGKVVAGLVRKVDRNLQISCLSDIGYWESSV